MQWIRNAVLVCMQCDKDENSDTWQVYNLIMQAPFALAVVMHKATASVRAAAAKWCLRPHRLAQLQRAVKVTIAVGFMSLTTQSLIVGIVVGS